MTDDWLSNFGGVVKRQAEENERRRKEISDALESGTVLRLVHFAKNPDQDDPKDGVGWFRVDADPFKRTEGGFIAFRRHVNGYEDRQCDSITDVMVKIFWENIPK